MGRPRFRSAAWASSTSPTQRLAGWSIRSGGTRPWASWLAPPRLGRTWLALDLALSVATGTPCLDTFAVPEPGWVLVYLAEDPPTLVRGRLAGCASTGGLAWARFRSTSSPRPASGSISSATGYAFARRWPGSHPACSCSTPWSGSTVTTRTTRARSPSRSRSYASCSAHVTSPLSSSITCEREGTGTGARRCEAVATSTPGPTARSTCAPGPHSSPPSIGLHRLQSR